MKERKRKRERERNVPTSPKSSPSENLTAQGFQGWATAEVTPNNEEEGTFSFSRSLQNTTEIY